MYRYEKFSHNIVLTRWRRKHFSLDFTLLPETSEWCNSGSWTDHDHGESGIVRKMETRCPENWKYSVKDFHLFYFVCHKVTRYKVLNHTATYILTTQGMVSPISHLFNQEEHTPSCTGPTPPAMINYTVCIKLYILVLTFSDYPKSNHCQMYIF